MPRKNEAAFVCPFNDAIECDRAVCSRCGWNPVVKWKRLQRFIMEWSGKNGKNSR